MIFIIFGYYFDESHQKWTCLICVGVNQTPDQNLVRRSSSRSVLVRCSLVSWKISEKLRLQHRFQFVIIPNKSLKPQKINLQFFNFPQKSPIKTDKITDNFVWWPKRKSQIIKRFVNFWFILIYSGFRSYRTLQIKHKKDVI